MKTIALLCLGLFSIVTSAQFNSGEDVVITTMQDDDIYLAGEMIQVNASVRGDVIAAGANIRVNDSILGDFTAASGDIFLGDYVADDVRIAGGNITIDSEVGDDVVIFGGEVLLTENAIINGSLICYAGEVIINGKVRGNLKITGGDIQIDGIIQGSSKVIAEELEIKNNARFYQDFVYWSDNQTVDFKQSLVNSEAYFDESLKDKSSEFSWVSFGVATLFLWVFYILSAFIVLIVLHAVFRKVFSKVSAHSDKELLKSLGYGLVYLLGTPVLLALMVLILIGIPLALFLGGLFVFSLLFGHLVASLLLAYYFTRHKDVGFWRITFLALAIAVGLRLLTLIPVLGILISIAILAVSYGSIFVNYVQIGRKKLAVS